MTPEFQDQDSLSQKGSNELRILVDGLPRSGTTTLAKLFAIHPETRVIIEPFHPRRYEGTHFRAVVDSDTPHNAISNVWRQWNVVKHVWESGSGWPFIHRPEIQNQLWTSASLIITVHRRNLLKRYVSSEMSRRLGVWIGKRNQFIDRLNESEMEPFEIQRARGAIRADITALERRDRVLREMGITTIDLVFEDFYGAQRQRQFETLNSLYEASGLRMLSSAYLARYGTQWLDPEVYQWSSKETYRTIPNIVEFDAAFKDSGYGSLLDGSF